ncbi:uncharacterized protein EI90DRAFT_2629500 [Cantharellus anzutake]|uniref:uncharacterized protein n=1 Tax=Cantharellus anzutake TaxID=1750568 RepID=UPI00190526C7|nr:uncharacterized protein EI90DRAFT_2629500 [Cantharellus anzutake]KAF8319555.1 hypothetical protein EI90DRAFT_2629500 [Cantharellus anzutake]
MSVHESPWPLSSRASQISTDSTYFQDHISDHEVLTPSTTATFGTTSIRINPGSELPHHPPSSSGSPPPKPRSRKNTSTSASTKAPTAAPPLLSSSKVIKSTPLSASRPEEIWREILKTAYGRDKAFKIIQYTMRLILMVHTRTAFLFRQPRGGELARRLNISIGHLSITRKCLIMFNWLTPLTHIVSPPESNIPFASAATITSPTLMHRFLHAPPPVLLDLFNAISDDVSTLSKLGLLGARIGHRAGRLADWFWFASTLAGLVEVGAERAMVKGMLHELQERIYDAGLEMGTDTAEIEEDEAELKKLKAQYGWLQVTRMKLLMDLIFVSYDVFKLQKAKDSVKTYAGLASALLSTWKMYDRHRSELDKANA